MKRIFLFFYLIIAINCICKGQNYNQFTKNVGWCLEQYFGTGSTLAAYENNGDTLFNNLNYKKMTRDGSTTTLIREDTVQKKVWVILPDSTSETLLYDFNLIVGNQITLDYVGYSPISYQVDTVDNITTSLGSRKRIQLSTTDTNFAQELHWIEGIGSTYGPIYLLDPTFAAGQFGGNGHCLICCYQNMGVQSYLGNCGIPLAGLGGSACEPFISPSSIENFITKNSPVNTYFSTPNLLLIKSNKALIRDVRVFTVDGKLIDHYKSNSDQLSIQTNRWNKGIYFINITLSDNQVLTKKIMK
ncbi:MAG: hypothetical protein COB15_15740 [Flavobacteriales bacterium]|nr:MAG: hypothetical protein COB15_15740 [Flavobacteriales bacterium]